MANRGERSVEKEAFWKLAVDEWRQAGTSVREFCRSNGLKESAFYFWRRELAKRQGLATAESGTRPARTSAPKLETPPAASLSPTAMFLPLTLRSQETAASEISEAGAIEIVSGHHRVRVSPGFDEETLSRLLRLLAS